MNLKWLEDWFEKIEPKGKWGRAGRGGCAPRACISGVRVFVHKKPLMAAAAGSRRNEWNILAKRCPKSILAG